MLTEDGLIILVARLESLAADRDRFRRQRDTLEIRCRDLSRTLETAQNGNRRNLRDIKTAEAKVCEWAEYAGQLRSAIDALDPLARRKKKIVLPDMPKRLEFEIPF